jgi:class 3 adenylate cyclase
MQRRGGGRGLGAVLFTDIVGSTAIAAEMGNTRWSELVARHHRTVRQLIGRFGGHEVDTAGDGFFVAFERPADAIRCAVASTEAVRDLGIEIRAGVSFGELETVGRKPSGLVVNTAARVMAVAGPGEVLVPASIKDIVPGSGISFADHGVHQLKGLDGDFHLFGVTGVDGREVVPPLEAEEAAERRREIFPTPGRRSALIVGAAAGVLALVVVGWIMFASGDQEGRGRSSGRGRFENAVARIDPASGRIGSWIAVGSASRNTLFSYIDHPFAVGEGGLWVLRPPLLLHVDPLHRDVRERPIDVGLGNSETVLTGFDAVWVLVDRTVYRVNPATDERKPFLTVPPESGITTFSFALDEDLWVGISDGTMVRLDPRTQARDQVSTGRSIDKLATTSGAVWVADLVAGEIAPFDQDTLKPAGASIHLGGSIDQVVGQGPDLWVLDRQLGTVTRIEAASRDIDVVRVGDGASDMAVGLGAVWVGDLDGNLFRVDATTLESTKIPIGPEVLGVGVDDADGSVWVYVGEGTEPA